MSEQLVWLIDAKSDYEINMSITYKSKLPQDSIYRGVEKDGKQWEVYNTSTSPDKDYRPITK
jgi:hypothetical protein